MTDLIQSKLVLYGIVYGEHTHSALSKLCEQYPHRWEGFEWLVQLLKSADSMEIMLQIARSTNDRHND